MGLIAVKRTDLKADGTLYAVGSRTYTADRCLVISTEPCEARWSHRSFRAGDNVRFGQGKGVAIARLSRFAGIETWVPDIVKPQEIIATWADDQARRQAEIDERRATAAKLAARNEDNAEWARTVLGPLSKALAGYGITAPAVPTEFAGQTYQPMPAEDVAARLITVRLTPDQARWLVEILEEQDREAGREAVAS